jgi:putative Mn2+ efflux pump MntP
MVLGGFLIMLICQDIVAIKAFKKSVREGILCAMIPGYILFYANREGASQFAKPLIGWLAGIGILAMGVLR